MITQQEHPTVTSLPMARKRKDPNNRRSNLLTVFVWISVLYFVIPLLWLAISTTKDNTGLFSSFGLWFADSFEFFANIQNLATFQDGVFWRWMINTLLYAVVSAVGASLLAAAGGYALAKYRFRGRSVVVAVILGSIMVPLTALALPTYLVFAAANLTDTPWAIILPSLMNRPRFGAASF